MFDFASLNVDFGAALPDEFITYTNNLPDDLVRSAGALRC